MKKATRILCPLLLGPVLFALAWSVLAPVPASAEPEPITAENWTEKVSFKPDLSRLQFSPGEIVDKSNVGRFKSFIPKSVEMLIQKYKMKIKLAPYQPIHPSDGYIKATNRYRGQPQLVETGRDCTKRGIKGYTAGLPFPQPANGLEVAWNFHYHYGPDDGEVTYSVFWISASSGIEHTEEWRLSAIRGNNRTDIEPIPVIESMVSKGLQGAGMTYAISPYDKKGFGAVYFRHIEPRDGQGHVYVPSMRRILKNSFGTRGDTWNSTDLFYEDVRGYSGYPEWMDWKLKGKKTVLLPMHSGIAIGKNNEKAAYDFKNWPHWNPRYAFEPRPVYLLEATPKLPDYPYSKQYLFVDAESFHVLYKQAYDRKGALWKIMINSGGLHRSSEGGREVLGWAGTVVIDVQSEHATVFHVQKARANVGLNPDKFSVNELRKRSR